MTHTKEAKHLTEAEIEARWMEFWNCQEAVAPDCCDMNDQERNHVREVYDQAKAYNTVKAEHEWIKFNPEDKETWPPFNQTVYVWIPGHYEGFGDQEVNWLRKKGDRAHWAIDYNFMPIFWKLGDAPPDGTDEIREKAILRKRRIKSDFMPITQTIRGGG